MERRKFLNSVAVIIFGIAILPLQLSNAQEQSESKKESEKKVWKLILKNIQNAPFDIKLEAYTHKKEYILLEGKSELVDDSSEFELKIDINKIKGFAHTIVFSYKYKESEWNEIYIAGLNFNKGNNYTYELRMNKTNK
jgi:hypothetical protein